MLPTGLSWSTLHRSSLQTCYSRDFLIMKYSLEQALIIKVKKKVCIRDVTVKIFTLVNQGVTDRFIIILNGKTQLQNSTMANSLILIITF